MGLLFLFHGQCDVLTVETQAWERDTMLVTRILGRAASLGIDVTQHTQHQLECWLKRKGVDVSTGFVEVNKQSLYRDFVQHVAKNKPPGDTVNVLRLLLAELDTPPDEDALVAVRNSYIHGGGAVIYTENVLELLASLPYTPEVITDVVWVLAQRRPPQRYTCRRFVEGIAATLAQIGGLKALERMDHVEFAAMVAFGASQYAVSVRSLLRLCKGTKQLDSEGRWCGHLRHISRPFMDRFPVLWKYPADLGCVLESVGDEAFVLRWLWFADMLVSHRGRNRTRRHHQERLHGSVSKHVSHHLRLLRRLEQTSGMIDVLLVKPEKMQREDVKRLLGMMTAYQNRHMKINGGVKSTNPACPLDDNIKQFSGYIRAGAFPLVPTDMKLRHEDLLVIMGQLEIEKPDLYAADPPQRFSRDTLLISEAEAGALRSCCQSAKEGLVMPGLRLAWPNSGAASASSLYLWSSFACHRRPVVEGCVERGDGQPP